MQQQQSKCWLKGAACSEPPTFTQITSTHLSGSVIRATNVAHWKRLRQASLRSTQKRWHQSSSAAFTRQSWKQTFLPGECHVKSKLEPCQANAHAGVDKLLDHKRLRQHDGAQQVDEEASGLLSNRTWSFNALLPRRELPEEPLKVGRPMTCQPRTSKLQGLGRCDNTRDRSKTLEILQLKFQAWACSARVLTKFPKNTSPEGQFLGRKHVVKSEIASQ